MLEIEKSAGTYIARSSDLRLRFEYREDRWCHEVVCGTGGRSVILSSEEGTPNDPCPPCPAFQELRLETINADVCEFQLFGQAGKGIYSAAVRFDGNSGTITFDIAARANRAGAALCDRSTYVIQPMALVSKSEVGLRFNLPGGAVQLSLTTSAGTKTEESDVVMSEARGAQRILIGQLTAGGTNAPRTAQNARWEYAFRLDRLP